MKTSNKLYCFAILLLAGIGSVLIYSRTKKKTAPQDPKSAEIEIEQIEGPLNLVEIVSYFRNLNLKKGVDTPFIADCSFDSIRKLIEELREECPLIEGYKGLLLGVETNGRGQKFFKLINSLGWSEDLTKIMDNECMVILE